MTPSVPDSETVLLRRELVAVTRLLDDLKAKYAKDTGDMRLEIAGLRGEIDRLNVAAAQHAGCCGDKAEIARLRGEDKAEIARLRGEIDRLRGGNDRPGAGPAAPAARSRAAGNAAPGARGGECGAGAGGDAAKPGREPAGGEKDAGAMAAELKDAKRRLALYDHHNRTDARAYNADRAKFRRENGTYDSDRKPGKIGAPAGHKGASHRHKPGRKTVAKLHACEHCGSCEHLEPLRPANRIALMLESDGSITPVGIWAERAKCMKCCKISEAKSEAIPGTQLGLALLGIVAAYIAKALPDADIADLMEQLHGLKISPSAVLKARRAIARVLEAVYRRILEYMVAFATFVQFDETPIRIAGAQGYVWLACWGDAVYMVCVFSRSAAVLDAHFPGLKDKPAVTDQYSGYNGIKERQTCLIHVLRHSESGVVRTKDADEKEKEKRPYDRLRGMYRTVKPMDTAGGATIKELDSQVLDIAGEYGEGHKMHTALSNARPNMFTFLRHPGMPCHNNRVEQAIHEGPAKEKRSRRQLRSASGMRCLAVTCSVFQTGKRRGIWPARILEAAATDPNWNILDPPATGPPPPGKGGGSGSRPADDDDGLRRAAPC